MTTSRREILPGRDHPVTVKPVAGMTRIMAGAETLATSAHFLELHEQNQPTLAYFPIADVRTDLLEPSEKIEWCPYKGEACFFHIVLPDNTRIENGAWSFPSPLPSAAALKGHIAFSPKRTQLVMSA